MSCVSCLGNWSWMKILKAVAGVRWVAHHNLKSSWWIRDISFWEEVNWRDKETDTSWDVSGSPRHPLLRVCSLQWQRVFHHPHCGWLWMRAKYRISRSSLVHPLAGYNCDPAHPPSLNAASLGSYSRMVTGSHVFTNSSPLSSFCCSSFLSLHYAVCERWYKALARSQ